MNSSNMSDKQIRELRQRLADAEANLEAIRSGAADAIVVQTDAGASVFTIQGAEAAYRIMVETMNEGAITTDQDGVILYVNARFAQMLDYPSSSLVGKPLHGFIAESQIQEFSLFLKKTLAGGSVHRDFELIKRDLSSLPVYLSSAPLEIIGRHDLCIVASDLTERITAQRRLEELNNSLEQKVRKRTAELEYQKNELEKSKRKLQNLTLSLEEQVELRTEQVRELAKALSLAEQRQRQRFSFILHEDLQQVLFAMKIRFGLLKESIGKSVEGELEDDVACFEDLILKALGVTRRLAIEFNPPILKNEGLDAALQWLAKHIEKQYGLKLEVNIPEDFRILREEERVLIIQLVQELLLNVIKHSGTGFASVTATRDSRHIFVTVEDRGIGFDLEKEKLIARDRTHLGLFSIEERLRLFGGDLAIVTSPGKGTRITMKLPFDIGNQQLSIE